jgi:DNA-binding beta-propeller fold protein YncE
MVSNPANAMPITTPDVQTTVALPGNPFASAATHDGKWICVSLDANSNTGSLAVLRLAGHSATLVHVIPMPSAPFGLALTLDDHTLIAATFMGVSFVDVVKAEAGDTQAVMGTELGPLAIEVALSPDGRFIFATHEYQADMAVLDVQQAERDYYQPAAVVGTLPIEGYPVGMALSPDGRYLYIANEGSPGLDSLGTLCVANVARAEHAPAQLVIGRAHGGCGDGRVVLSPDGGVAWVSARASNEVLAFDTTKLLTDPRHALLATIPVGPEPVGLLPVNGGAELLVANSNRFAPVPTPQTVYG